MNQSKVSVLSAASYDEILLDKVIAQHMENLDFARLVKPESKVLLKPNLLMKRQPDQATTTHPALLGAVIRWLKAAGVVDITIADSPGGPYTASVLEGVYRGCGIAEAAERYGAKLNTATGWSRVDCSEGETCKSFGIIDPVREADLIINLPKLKTHGMMQLSAGVKNLFGAVPGLQKPELHFQFPEQKRFASMLVDLCEVVKPTLTILDGIVSMEGDGPSSGIPKATGITFAAEDVYALDLAAMNYIDMPLEVAFTVAEAVTRGLCPTSVEELIYLGEGRPEKNQFVLPTSRPLNFAERMPGFLSKPAGAFAKRFLSPRPVVEKAKCIGCGKCEESCAPKAIRVTNRKAAIHYRDCIRCFCCHEMCPVRAIDIRRFSLLSH